MGANMKKRKLIGILTIIAVIITLIYGTMEYIVPILIKYQFIFDHTVSSIGIIGAADGPTSILIAKEVAPDFIGIIFAACSITGIIYLIITKYGKNQ
jgi:Na+-transporting methylmalonyl-CoA/oxaloacetate decarboxylase beta subunit